MNAGSRVAHYEILSIIGRGGMGEVYKARDSKLERDVALKTLSPEFAGDAERVARLQREATLIAALNHPNIAAIYGIEEHEGRKFLVLELVEGGTLADRLRGRPLAIGKALETAIEIAAALESAHDRGIVHRDLKPDNVAFTSDGLVKVLDFGLGRSLGAGTSRPAVTAARTELGVAMGTAPYMSPEQARGEASDRQTDIWALGVTLYEMLTGISPFERSSSTETLACVLEGKPDFDALPPSTPATVKRLIRRCLEKERKRRFRDIGDVRIELEDALTGLQAETGGASARRRKPLRTGAAAVGVVILLGLAGLGLRSLAIVERPPPREVVRLSVTGFERGTSLPYGTQDLAISPDGSMIAHTSATGLSVRRLRDGAVVRLEPELLASSADPFFSPDGAWIAAGHLQRTPSAGGASTFIVEHTDRAAGGAWSRDGTIVYATSSGLYRVAADGGEPELLAKPDPDRGELLFAWPHHLPNRSAVLYTIVPVRGSIDAAQVALLDLETRETRVLLTGGTSPRYSPTGHLVYAARQRLFAIAFDADSGTTSGQPVELDGIAVATQADNGAASFAFADNGTLVFVEPDALQAFTHFTLSWVDRDGNETPLPLEPNRYNGPRVSPDGSRVAFDIPGVNRDIWIWDLARESLTRLTDGPNEDLLPLWTHDGSRIYFTSGRSGDFDIYSQVADGSSPARRELAIPGFEAGSSLSPDGTKLIVSQNFGDIAMLDLAQSALEPLFQSDASEWLGELSPDGRWLAFDSNESGQFEVYLRPYPDVTGGRVQVSAGNGGGFPRWGPPGSNELYYVTADGAMMAVSIELEPTLRVGRPTKLFQYATTGQLGTSGRQYDVGADGRFLVRRVVADPSQSATVTVVLNWFEELREQVPLPD